MRRIVLDFIQICSENLSIDEPIYEFGSLQVEGQEGFADLRPFFKGKEYVGADMRPGKGVDVLLDLHCIDLPAESVGTVIMADTLEHVEYPRTAIDEIFRVLKPSGVMIMSSVMNFPIHDHPYDFWRFTPKGFESLLNVFSGSFVYSIGRADFPHTLFGIGFKGEVPEHALKHIELLLERLPPEEKMALTQKIKRHMKRYMPRFLLVAYEDRVKNRK